MRAQLDFEFNAGGIGPEILRAGVRRPAIRLALREQMQLQYILEA